MKIENKTKILIILRSAKKDWVIFSGMNACVDIRNC